MQYDLKKGDCAYIPAYWWHAVRTATSSRPGPAAPQEDKDEFDKKVRQMSVTVDFWYEPHSVWLENIFYGLETKLLR